MEINMAKAFSPIPLGRHRSDGGKSGEEFREDILLPKIAESMAAGDVLVVSLDGMEVLSGSFLEEAFGGLVREHGVALADVEKTLQIKGDKHFTSYIESIWQYIRTAADVR